MRLGEEGKRGTVRRWVIAAGEEGRGGGTALEEEVASLSFNSPCFSTLIQDILGGLTLEDDPPHHLLHTSPTLPPRVSWAT